MGLFDSFFVEIDGREVELQSKRFDQVLEHYHVGDVVSGAPAGVRVYVDSARLMTRMVQALGAKQDRIVRLQGRIGYARGTIEDARRIRAGEHVRHPLLQDTEATKRIRQGDDPLDVLAWLLGDDAPDDVGLGFRGQYQMAGQDPLEPYRL